MKAVIVTCQGRVQEGRRGIRRPAICVIFPLSKLFVCVSWALWRDLDAGDFQPQPGANARSVKDWTSRFSGWNMIQNLAAAR